MTNEHEHEVNIRASSSGMISQDQFKMQYRINILVDIAESIKTKPNLKWTNKIHDRTTRLFIEPSFISYISGFYGTVVVKFKNWRRKLVERAREYTVS